MENNKKKRGSNYTEAEKATILELINKYKDIIENKGTTAAIIRKKRDSWDAVTRQYNALSSSGPRTWKQLRHLYENLKQRTKKTVAKESEVHHKQYYERELRQLINYSVNDNDKKEINNTEDGSYRNMITVMDGQVLAKVAPQVQNLNNSYDDAEYFGDADNHASEAQDANTSDDDNKEPLPWTMMECQEEPPPCIKKSPSVIFDTLSQEIDPKTNTSHQPNEKQTTTSNTEKYYEIKLKNAQLERRFLIQKHKMELRRHKWEQNRHRLEIEILKLRLKKLQNKK